MTVDGRTVEQREWDDARDEALKWMVDGGVSNWALAARRAVEKRLGPRPTDPVTLPPLTDEQVERVTDAITSRHDLSGDLSSIVRDAFPRPEDAPVPVDERQVREQTIREVLSFLRDGFHERGHRHLAADVIERNFGGVVS